MKEILQYTIYSNKDFSITIGTLVALAGFWLGIVILLRLSRRGLKRIHRIDPTRQYSIFLLLKYIVIVAGFVISLQILSFNISILLAGSAALLVGFGLGIQRLFSDYVSGIVILFDGSVKQYDIIEVDGLVCQVQDIKLRTTLVKTRDDKYVILPNTKLTESALINWTHHTQPARFDVMVGVSYSSDLQLVRSILLEVVAGHELIIKEPKPFVRINEHNNSSIDCSVYFWTNEMFRVENIKSDVRFAITEKFRKNNVEIPFPQRVLHLPAGVEIKNA